MLLSVSTATPKTPRRWPPAEALVFSRTVSRLARGLVPVDGSAHGSLSGQLPLLGIDRMGIVSHVRHRALFGRFVAYFGRGTFAVAFGCWCLVGG